MNEGALVSRGPLLKPAPSDGIVFPFRTDNREMQMKPRAAILIPSPMREKTFSQEEIRRLEGIVRVSPGVLRKPVLPEAVKDVIAGADACITGWGTCPLSPDVLDAALPR